MPSAAASSTELNLSSAFSAFAPHCVQRREQNRTEKDKQLRVKQQNDRDDHVYIQAAIGLHIVLVHLPQETGKAILEECPVPVVIRINRDLGIEQHQQRHCCQQRSRTQAQRALSGALCIWPQRCLSHETVSFGIQNSFYFTTRPFFCKHRIQTSAVREIRRLERPFSTLLACVSSSAVS